MESAYAGKKMICNVVRRGLYPSAPRRCNPESCLFPASPHRHFPGVHAHTRPDRQTARNRTDPPA